MKRAPRRWRSRFGLFVSDFTVVRLAGALNARGVPVTRKAIYEWIAGRARPRPEAARAIVSVSAGRVRLDDLYPAPPKEVIR